MALFINGVGQNSFAMNGVDIDNLYVDGVLVFTSIVPEATIPRYELSEALVDASTVDDSANTLGTYNGLLTESDGTTPYEPTELQYPMNGLLELSNGRILDTQFTIDVANDTYGLYGIYDADGSSTYKIWALDMFGASLGTLYEGDQDTPLTATGGIGLDVQTGTWKITDGRPSWMPPIGEELWDGNWNPDNTLYFNEITCPPTGEVCGPDNFTTSVSFHYMTNAIDVTSANSVLISGDGNRLVIMGKTTSDGLCRYLANAAAGEDLVFDTSDLDYIIIYNGLGEVPEPNLSVKKES